jgi:hypothetical protein
LEGQQHVHHLLIEQVTDEEDAAGATCTMTSTTR